MSDSKNAGNYAPRRFALSPNAERYSKKDFARAMENLFAALPLSPRELTRCFPDVWGRAKAAEGELTRLGLNTLAALIEYLLGVRGYLSRAEYRRAGDPGRPVQALVSGPPERARETLASVVGPDVVIPLGRALAVACRPWAYLARTGPRA